MKLTPQQLIDLPGYGRAEKQLRKEGRWELTADEKRSVTISKAMQSLEDALDDASNAIRDADNAIDDALTEYRSIAKEAQCN